MTHRIPFSLDRKIAAPLSVQMAEGLRAAISSGFYRDGDVLPTIHEFARLLGTSVRVPREAITALAAEGLLKPRRRIGCIVVGRGSTVWRGGSTGSVPVRPWNVFTYSGLAYAALLRSHGEQ